MNWFVYHCSVILSYFVSGTATINPWFKITMPRFQPSGGLTDHFVSQKKRRDQALPFTRRSAAKIIHDDAIQLCLYNHSGTGLFGNTHFQDKEFGFRRSERCSHENRCGILCPGAGRSVSLFPAAALRILLMANASEQHKALRIPV